MLNFQKIPFHFLKLKPLLNNEDCSELNIQIKNNIILAFIKNSIRFRNSFLNSSMIDRNGYINLILLINSKISRIPSYRQIIKRKMEYYIKNNNKLHHTFKLYILHIDSENFHGKEENGTCKTR